MNHLDFRPKTFDQVVGQDEIKEYLKIKISAFRKTNITIGHILFLGFSGTGKTTLANVVANEMQVGFHSVMATRIKNWDDLYSILKNVQENDVLFIDEIHALAPKIQEQLYEVMEDFRCTFHDKDRATPLVINLPVFTLIGATTHSGELNAPLLSRFQYKAQLDPYTVHQLKDMVIAACDRTYGLDMPDDVAYMIGKLSRRTARICYNLLKSYIQVVEAEYSGRIYSHMLTKELLSKTLKHEKLDPIVGLDTATRRYLVAMLRDSVPLGSRSLASMIGEQESTVLHMIEPFLLSEIQLEYSKDGSIQKMVGPFCQITKKGRRATESAFKYIKLCNVLQQSGWFNNESLNI
jgi:Holliday junction DNA helicase RuvB